MTLDEKIERVELALTRWHRRLTRAANAIKRLEAKRKRLNAKSIDKPMPAPIVPVSKTGVAVIPAKHFNQTVAVPVDDLSIPAAFLRPKPNAADEAAKAEIIAELEAAKKEKTKARIARLKADKAGDRKAMPLQGKDALKAIHG